VTRKAIWAHAIVQIAYGARVLGYLAEWYRMYRKSGLCGPKMRLRTNQKNRSAGSLSLFHRNTLMSLLHSSMTARAWACLMKQVHVVGQALAVSSRPSFYKSRSGRTHVLRGKDY
jgi:hypothetical protein